jgi:hypothetical protein
MMLFWSGPSVPPSSRFFLVPYRALPCLALPLLVVVRLVTCNRKEVVGFAPFFSFLAWKIRNIIVAPKKKT